MPLRFPESFLDEIRARLPVSEVVRVKVALRRAGKEWRGLSPFNPEKTPSFFVNDQKGFYHDFSSGRHGDQFRFLMETEGVSFRESVERLAAKAGIPVPEASPEAEAASAKRKTLREVVEAVTVYFEEQLQQPPGEKARAYLVERGIDDAQTKKFRIGYAPDGAAFVSILHRKGIQPEQLEECGLLVVPEGQTMHRPRFSDRLMFPIADLQGRVVAFGARAMREGQEPKYLNSPEGPLFHKGALLYNAHAARAAAYAKKPLLGVEGYMDVIALDSIGVAAVATMGTAVTVEQLQLMWRWAEEPVLCLDGDAPGQAAAGRAAGLAMPLLAPGKSLRFLTLPEGLDPDKLVRTEGAEAFAGLLERASALADVVWRRETYGQAFDTPERKAGLEQRLREVVKSVADKGVRGHYGRQYDAALKTLFAGTAVAELKGPGERVSKFGAITWNDLQEHGKPYEWLIKNMVPRRQSLLIMGRSKSGKSFMTFDMAAAVALGQPDYMGRRVTRAGVAWCAYEPDDPAPGLRKRVTAYQNHHQVKFDGVPFVILTRPPKLFEDEKAVDALAEELIELSAGWDVPLEVIVIDTHNAATRGSSEIKSEDVSRILDRYSRLARRTEAGLWIIGHTNTEGRHRGNEQVFNTFEASIKVDRIEEKRGGGNAAEIKDEDGRVIRRAVIDKQREGQDGVAFDFILRQVTIGKDSDGDPITSCVIEPPARREDEIVARDEQQARKPVDKRGFRLNPAEVLFFKALLASLDRVGQAPPPELKLPASVARVVSWTALKEEYGKKVPNDETDSEDGRRRYRDRVKTAVRRAREVMERYNIIGIDQVGAGDKAVHYLWPTGRPVWGPGLQDWPPGKAAAPAGAPLDFSKLKTGAGAPPADDDQEPF